MPPKFGGTTEKCKICNKTAYEMESCVYDKMTFHKTCFKCLQCKKTLQISSVAMIKGDLYCKNCFVRLFKEKGRYEVFGEKTLPNKSRNSITEAKSSPPKSSPLDQPAEVMVVETVAVEQVSVEATPVEAAPVEAAPVEQAVEPAVEPAPVEPAVEVAPVEAAPMEQAPVEQEQAPMEQAPVEEAPMEQAPVEQEAPANNEETPAEY